MLWDITGYLEVWGHFGVYSFAVHGFRCVSPPKNVAPEFERMGPAAVAQKRSPMLALPRATNMQPQDQARDPLH